MRLQSIDIKEFKRSYPVRGKKWCQDSFGLKEWQVRHLAASLGLRLDKTSAFFQEFQRRAALSKVGKKRPDQAVLMKRLIAEGRIPRTPKKFTTRHCLQCGTPFEITPCKDRQFCSPTCRAKVWERHPHPRGFKNGTHSATVKDKLSKLSKSMWSNPKAKVNSKSYRRKLSDRMSQQAVARLLANHGENTYSRTVKGWRVIAGKRHFFKSKWEANAARLLTFEKREWQYEVKTFWFLKIKRGVRSYTPDFYLPAEDLFIEVKGWWDAKSLTKMKRMKKYYSNVKIEVWDSDFFKALNRQGIPRLVNEWE